MQIKIQFKSIRQRLLVVLCISIGCVLLPGSVFLYVKASKDLSAVHYERLQTLRDLRVTEINSWIARMSDDVRIIAGTPEVRAKSTFLSAGGHGRDGDWDDLRRIFNSYFQFRNFYFEFFIVSTSSGKVVFSTSQDSIGDDRSSNVYLAGAMRKRDVFVSDIYYSKNLNLPTMTASIPVDPPHGAMKEPRAVLVARVYLERSLYSLLLDRTGLGRTGEVILINKDQVAVNKLKSENVLPLTLTLRDEAATRALSGQTGVVEVTDYRGRRVSAAYGYIPSMNWGIIVKQDRDEITGPLVFTAFSIAIFFALLMGAIVLVSLRVSYSLAGPLESFSRVARRILGGDYYERIDIDRSDEIGDLAASFNGVADSIVSQLRVEKVSSDIIEVIVSTIDLHEFSRKVIGKVMEVTESNIAAFYVLSEDEREFRHFNSIGLDAQYSESFHAGRLEGEFGRALSTREITVTRDLDENSLVLLKTVLGNVLPREIITFPIIVHNMSAAVISLASLKGYPAETVRILEHIRPVMNTAYSNILAIEKTRRLADELKDKNFQLESKKEALELQTVELKRHADRVKQQNFEMEIQKAKVEEASKLKSEFLSNMSHELRTPLNSVLALSKVLILQAGDRLTEEENDYVRIISRNGEKLLMLINDILDLSKIEAGKIYLHPKKISIRGTLGMIVENLEQMAEEKKIRIVLSCRADLPEIVSDESRVYQILQNIIGNAVKFTEEGSVSISASVDDERLRIAVEDTGIGIDEADLPHIFEEFRQLDGTLARKYEGTGLGLAIAVKSAELISATISVESEKGKGSRFEVIFPLVWTPRRDALEHTAPGPYPRSADAASPSGVEEPFYDTSHGPRKGGQPGGGTLLYGDTPGGETPSIVVIEDDPDNMTTIRAVLKDGYRIFEAVDGRSGMELVQRHLPELVLLDIALPGISGFTVIKELKSNALTRHIPVIALTALSMKGDRERILRAGCDDYLAKPYNIEELTDKIAHWTGAQG